MIMSHIEIAKWLLFKYSYSGFYFLSIDTVISMRAVYFILL